jgi:tyrosine-protein kinase Etk/Wzc
MRQETVLNPPEISSPSELLPAGAPQSASEEDGIDLVGLFALLLRGKKTILRFMLVSAILTAIVVYLVMKPTYTGEAVFLPPQNAPGSSMSQLAGQLGSLGSLGALGGLAGLKNPGEVYIGILGSRTVADGIIRRFDLQKIYKRKRLSDTEKRLKSSSKFVAGKDTLITISVEAQDPKLAADLANGYLDALREQNARLALSDSSQRRLFFEQQLEREKNALADAEVDLKKTQEQTGLIIPNGQAQVEIQSSAELHAQITGRQVELAALKQGATDQNPAVVRLQTEISGLEQQLQKLQSDSGKREPGSIQLPTAKVPELALEYVRKQREVKYHEVLFELIARQYETARMDESREAPLLQVVDRATVPDKKSGPPRVLLMLAGCMLGAFAGVSWIILRNFMRTLQEDPAKAAQVETLRQAALSRR